MNEKIINQAKELVKSFKALDAKVFAYTTPDNERKELEQRLWDTRHDPVIIFNRLNEIWIAAGNSPYPLGLNEEGKPIYPHPLDEKNHFPEDLKVYLIDFMDEFHLVLNDIEELAEKVRKL